MTYSMDSDPTAAGRHSPSSALPTAYAFQRSERLPPGGEGDDNVRPGSFATTEDSITDQSMDRSVDYTEYSTTTGEGYEGLLEQRQRQMGGDGKDTSIAGGGGNLNTFYQYQEEQEGYNNDGNDNNNLATVNEYQAAGLQGLDPNNAYNSDAPGGDDATETIHLMHKKLLHLLSFPELFHDAIDWQDMLDKGIDPAAPATGSTGGLATVENNNKESSESWTEFEEDSTFRGLKDDDTEDGKGKKVSHSANETFEFSPSIDDESTAKKEEDEGETKEEAEQKPREEPLPHQIFAPDAEVVLPQALTASQLFGIERQTGIELEAAAGITGLSQLFLRWLALLPEGDHMNVIDPPGLTVMKISGGGYRVTGAHRVVWRWMNKFSPASTGGQSTHNIDFDFGDLVSMTVIDVFETDTDGRLLSYCPTFDNRAVHKTPEMAERLRKGATQLRETMGVVANSPVGKNVGMGYKMSIRAAFVVGNAVKNRIQHNYQSPQDDDNDKEGDSLNDLLQSQIEETDETEVDINEVHTSALEKDPTSSPDRRQLV